MYVPTMGLTMVIKTKDPYDLIDWNDLCKSHMNKATLHSNHGPVFSAMAKVSFSSSF